MNDIKFKIGDKVKTKKGCRIKGCFDILEIVETGKIWGRLKEEPFPAVVCRKENGDKRLFLVKNLERIDK